MMAYRFLYHAIYELYLIAILFTNITHYLSASDKGIWDYDKTFISCYFYEEKVERS